MVYVQLTYQFLTRKNEVSFSTHPMYLMSNHRAEKLHHFETKFDSLRNIVCFALRKCVAKSGGGASFFSVASGQVPKKASFFQSDKHKLNTVTKMRPIHASF